MDEERYPCTPCGAAVTKAEGGYALTPHYDAVADAQVAQWTCRACAALLELQLWMPDGKGKLVRIE